MSITLMKYIGCALIVPTLIGSAIIDDVTAGQNEITELDYNRAPVDYGGNYVGNVEASGSTTWLDTARNALSGPAGQIVVHVAKEMISRSTGNSQILSLNLTNLMILVLLKALIFAAGLIGAGNWGHYARSRSLNCEYWKILLFVHEIQVYNVAGARARILIISVKR